MEERKLYAYPCENPCDCLKFMEGFESLGFNKCCETVCGSCPYCSYLHLPYTEEGD